LDPSQAQDDEIYVQIPFTIKYIMHISPSVLSADFGNLNADLLALEAYVDRWHIDVMDGVFVPNVSF
jgi:ribulose-phosphate 3-epimerase